MKPVTRDQWRSISAYLDQALELEEPARASVSEALDALSVAAGEQAPWTRQARSLLGGLPQ
jgi:hypothetical protein